MLHSLSYFTMVSFDSEVYKQDLKTLPTLSGIYFVYKETECVYIGKTINLKKRWYSHHIYKEDFDTVKYIIVKPDELDKLETKYIRLLNPKFNINKIDCEDYLNYLNPRELRDIESKAAINIIKNKSFAEKLGLFEKDFMGANPLCINLVLEEALSIFKEDRYVLDRTEVFQLLEKYYEKYINQAKTELDLSRARIKQLERELELQGLYS